MGQDKLVLSEQVDVCLYRPSLFTWSLWVLGLISFGGVTGWLFYRHLIGVMITSGMSLVFLKEIYHSQKKKYKERLLDVFMDITVWLQAGIQSGKSMEMVVLELNRQWQIEKPVHYAILMGEVKRWSDQIRIGGNLTSIIADFSERSRMPLLMQFSMMLEIGQKQGANLLEIIQLTHRILREQRQIQQEMTVLIAQKQLEQKLLSAMPLVMMAMMQWSAPDFIAPLYTTFAGRAMMTLALIVFSGCYLWGSRISQCQSKAHPGQLKNQDHVFNRIRVIEKLAQAPIYAKLYEGCIDNIRMTPYWRKLYTAYQLILGTRFPEAETLNHILEAVLVGGLACFTCILTLIMSGFENIMFIAYLVLGHVLVVYIYIARPVQYAKKINAEIDDYFPVFLQQLALLMGTGMPLQGAMQLLSKQNSSNEMRSLIQLLFRDLQAGKPLHEGILIWGQIAPSRHIARFVVIVTQGQRHGLNHLSNQFLGLADESLKELHVSIRRRSEQASTKLLFPMLVSMLFVMLLMVYPIAVQFQSF